MGKLGRVIKSLFTTRSTSPGKAVVIQLVGAGGIERTAEMYHNPGISSMPTPEDRVVELPIGRSGSRVIIASHNYRAEVEPETGETIIYSTNAAGDTVKSKIHLKTDGTIDINGDSKRLVTYDELNTALQNHTHAAGTLLDSTGAPVTGATGTPVALDLSAAETTTVKTGG